MGNNIKVNLKELGCGGANVIQLIHVSVRVQQTGFDKHVLSVCLSVCLLIPLMKFFNRF
jgi:hypothetical protein